VVCTTAAAYAAKARAKAAVWKSNIYFLYSLLGQWFGQFQFSSWSRWLMKLPENSALRAATIGQAKSTGYFMKLRD